MDLAQLALGVDTTPLKSAQTELQKLRAIALGTAKDADKFNDSLEEGSSATDKLEKSTSRLLGPLGSMGTLMKGLFAGLSIGALGSMADTWSDVSARVGVAIGDMDAADGVMDKLSRTARLTYSSLGQTAEGFVRNSTVLQALGKSTQEQIEYTEALNLALVASGTKGQAALSVQEALSKAMTNGKMATEQLQTVLNNSSEVSKALAAELNTTVLGLSAMATQGRITGDVVFNALTKRLEEFTTKAEEMPATIGDGFLLLGNAVTALVGTFDQLGGVSGTVAGWMINLADGIMWVAQNTDTVTKVMWTLAPAMVAAFGPTVYGYVAALAGMIATNLTTAVITLFTAIRAHPFVMMATVLATVVSAMYQWRDSFPAIGAAFDWLWEKASFVIETIKTAIESIPFLKGLFEGGSTDVNVNVNADGASAKIGAAFTAGGVNAAEKIQGGIEKGGLTAARLMQQAQAAAQARYEQMNGKHVQQLGKVMVDGGKYTYNQVTGAFQKSAPTVTDAMEKGGGFAGQKIGSAMESAGQKVGVTVYNSLESAFASLAHILDVFKAFQRRERVELSKIQAETAKLQAETQSITQGGGSSSRSSGSSSSSSSSGSSSSSVGSSTTLLMNPGSSPDMKEVQRDIQTMMGTFSTDRTLREQQIMAQIDNFRNASWDRGAQVIDDMSNYKDDYYYLNSKGQTNSRGIGVQLAQELEKELKKLRASPVGQTWEVFQGAPGQGELQKIQSGSGGANELFSSLTEQLKSGPHGKTASTAPVNITNVLDPQMVVDTVGSTDAGSQAILNVIKVNKTEIRNLLGRI